MNTDVDSIIQFLKKHTVPSKTEIGEQEAGGEAGGGGAGNNP